MSTECLYYFQGVDADIPQDSQAGVKVPITVWRRDIEGGNESDDVRRAETRQLPRVT